MCGYNLQEVEHTISGNLASSQKDPWYATHRLDNVISCPKDSQRLQPRVGLPA